MHPRPGRRLAAALFLLCTGTASAQTGTPAPAVEFVAGSAAFVDESPIAHWAFGGALRYYLTPRLAIGPEFLYLRGPGNDRDLAATANVTLDFRRGTSGRAGGWTPYVVGGVGWTQYRNRFGDFRVRSNEWAFTAGGGARAWISDRVYVGGDVRLGWELNARVAGQIGVSLGR